MGAALGNRKVPGSIPALVRLADARRKPGGGGSTRAVPRRYGTAAAASLAAAARASPEFAGKLLRLDALDVMRDALADDAASPARASAALSALVARRQALRPLQAGRRPSQPRRPRRPRQEPQPGCIHGRRNSFRRGGS